MSLQEFLDELRKIPKSFRFRSVYEVGADAVESIYLVRRGKFYYPITFLAERHGFGYYGPKDWAMAATALGLDRQDAMLIQSACMRQRSFFTVPDILYDDAVNTRRKIFSSLRML